MFDCFRVRCSVDSAMVVQGLIAAGWIGLIHSAPAVGPVFELVNSSQARVELLANGNFEKGSDGKVSIWKEGPKGFVLAEEGGRTGSRGVRCENPTGQGWYGASQTLTVNRTSAVPLVVSGWSKAADVSGSGDSDYSLYVDVLYADGTPLWGQTANFRTGTHDWERRELTIIPEKPVQEVTLHCLFRNHSGTAWFDDVSVREVTAPIGAVLFQGAAVMQRSRPTATGKNASLGVFDTQDGLMLKMHDNTVASLKVGGRELTTSAASGFLARDVAANSGFFGFQKGELTELGLKLKSQIRSLPDHLEVSGRLTDTTGKDRAVTLVFALPVDALGWHWGDDIRHNRLIERQAEFSKPTAIRCGATGTMSVYPLGAVWGETEGLALAIDMAQPAQYRIGYHAGTKQLFIAYDFGLVPETERFPSSADFRFLLYRFEPPWGFRAAFAKLTQIDREYFVVRSREQGIWMPFTDVSTVEGWQDFGFRYHEGNNNVPWDDAQGVLSFRYTEPMTWWMRMPKEVPRTMAEAVRWRDQLAQGPREPERQLAQVSSLAGMWDDTGQPGLLFRNEPWCNGAVWSLNPNPHLPGTVNAATVHWNEKIREKLYGAESKGKLDGEYLDSLEGYVTADLNFRREHFRYTTVPLTFSSESKQPALFKGLAIYEFTRWFCDEVHRLGKLTFANGVPYRFTYLCPWLDVLGTETDWVTNGKYRPVSDEQMSLWRTMSGAKPYLLLMNTDYDIFTSAMVERYFQRSLFYGMFPGMFSHNAADNPYWQNPKWYNRDRALFKKYLPLIKAVAEAGWQPVTCAECGSRILVERFGSSPTDGLYLTLLNDTDSKQSGTLRIDAAALGLKRATRGRELISGSQINESLSWQFEFLPQEAKVVQVLP